MNGEDLRARIEADAADRLSLLGSREFLRAAGGGDPTPAALLDAAAASEHAARETFREWVSDERDEAARRAFESVAEQETEHRERVAAELDGWTPDGGGPGPMHAYLRGRTATVERVAGGMVGRPLVTLRTHERLVDFFERRGDASRVDLFRDLRGETAAVLDDGLALLDARCAADGEWRTARTVAAYTIRLAADDTADALRSLGIDPGLE